jgi:hypothetical protein
MRTSVPLVPPSEPPAGSGQGVPEHGGSGQHPWVGGQRAGAAAGWAAARSPGVRAAEPGRKVEEDVTAIARRFGLDADALRRVVGEAVGGP